MSAITRVLKFFENGGVYFDADMELIKPIDDIIEKGPFMGLEEPDKAYAAPGLGLAEEMLDNYHNSHFEQTEYGKYEKPIYRGNTNGQANC